jgi:hypothetical protein
MFSRRILLFIVIMICNAALSCGPRSILLINLNTNDLSYCPVGEGRDACIERLEAAGYIRADRLTPAQKASLGVSFPY